MPTGVRHESVSVRGKEGFPRASPASLLLLVKKEKEARKKVYAANRFARGAMVCPSCQYVLEESAAECPKCGFCGQISVEKFPYPPPALGPVLDPNQYLSKGEKAAIIKKVQTLQKRLPQVRFLNCLVPLGDEVNLREFGFWLLNAGQLKEGDEAKTFAVLFLIDPKGKMISVTVGYGLDALVMDTQWVQVCESCRDLCYRQKFGAGIETFLNSAFELLSERAIAIQKEVKK